jgi:hypothetical protein
VGGLIAMALRLRQRVLKTVSIPTDPLDMLDSNLTKLCTNILQECRKYRLTLKDNDPFSKKFEDSGEVLNVTVLAVIFDSVSTLLHWKSVKLCILVVLLQALINVDSSCVSLYSISCK